jgi:hypothetical protein
MVGVLQVMGWATVMPSRCGSLPGPPFGLPGIVVFGPAPLFGLVLLASGLGLLHLAAALAPERVLGRTRPWYWYPFAIPQRPDHLRGSDPLSRAANAQVHVQTYAALLLAAGVFLVLPISLKATLWCTLHP